MILIGYDGSEDAHAAIERAGELMPGEAATVLTVWERFADVIARTAVGPFHACPGPRELDRIDADGEQTARALADAGVRLAKAAGLNAQPLALARDYAIAPTIISAADAVGARAIVLGTRGLSALKAAVLGSVSHDVARHAALPVIVAHAGSRDRHSAVVDPAAARPAVGPAALTSA